MNCIFIAASESDEGLVLTVLTTANITQNQNHQNCVIKQWAQVHSKVMWGLEGQGWLPMTMTSHILSNISLYNVSKSHLYNYGADFLSFLISNLLGLKSNWAKRRIWRRSSEPYIKKTFIWFHWCLNILGFKTSMMQNPRTFSEDFYSVDVI